MLLPIHRNQLIENFKTSHQSSQLLYRQEGFKADFLWGTSGTVFPSYLLLRW